MNASDCFTLQLSPKSKKDREFCGCLGNIDFPQGGSYAMNVSLNKADFEITGMLMEEVYEEKPGQWGTP